MKYLLTTAILLSTLLCSCGGASDESQNSEGIRISYARITELSSKAGSGITGPQVIVMNSQVEFDTTWSIYTANMSPKPTKPTINFKETTLIAFFPGAFPSPCTPLVIDYVKDAGFETRIYYHQGQSNPLVDCAQVIIYPHEWILINKTTDTIKAIKRS